MKRSKKILGAILAAALVLSLTSVSVFAAGGKNAPNAENGRGRGYSVSENDDTTQRPRRNDCLNYEDCPLAEDCPRLNQDGTATPRADRQKLRDGTGCNGTYPRNAQCPLAA